MKVFLQQAYCIKSTPSFTLGSFLILRKKQHIRSSKISCNTCYHMVEHIYEKSTDVIVKKNFFKKLFGVNEKNTFPEHKNDFKIPFLFLRRHLE